MSTIFDRYGPPPFLSSEHQKMLLTTKPKNDITDSISNYETRLKAIGQDTKKLQEDVAKERRDNLILKALDIIDRPRNAIASAIKNVTDADPATTGWEGFKAGLKGEQKVSGAELVFGDKAENEDGKFDIGKFIAGLGMDIVIDPLTYATFGLGKLLKGILTGVPGTMTDDAAKALIKAGHTGFIDKTARELYKEGFEKAMRGMAGKNLSEKAMREIAEASAARYADDFIKQLGKFRVNPLDDITGEAAQAAAKATLKPRTAKAVGFTNLDEMAKAVAKYETAVHGGRGISVFGKELVSGSRMQDIGAGVTEAVKKLHPAVRTFVEGIQNMIGSAFKKVNFRNSGPWTEKLVRRIEQEARGTESLLNMEAVATTQRWLREMADAIRKRGGGTRLGEALDEMDDIVRRIIEAGGEGVDDITANLGKQLDVTARRIADEMAKDFAKWGAKEQDVGLLRTLLENYFPHVKRMDLDGTVIRSYKGGKTREFKIVNLNALRRKYHGSVDEVNKYIAEITGDAVQDFFETSATKAYVLRAMHHNRVIADRRIIDEILTSLGRPVHEVQDKLLDGSWIAVVPKSKFTAVALPKNYQAAMDELGMTLDDVIKGFQRGDFLPGTVNEDIANKFLALQKKLNLNKSKVEQSRFNALMKELATIGGDELIDAHKYMGSSIFFANQQDIQTLALPKDVVDYINRATRLQLDEGTYNVAKIADAFHRAWKPLATGLNPAYHMRNILGSEGQNFFDIGLAMFNPQTRKAALEIMFSDLIEDASPKLAKKLYNKTIDIGGKKWTYKQLKDEMMRTGALNSFFMTDSQQLKDIIRRSVETGFEVDNAEKILKHYINPLAAGKRFGNAVEMQTRAVNFITHLKQGMSPIDAAEMVKKYHFDYLDLSDFERNVMKRILPFYSWMRKNIPMQLEMLLDNPGKYNVFQHMQQNAAAITGADMSAMPEWLAEQVPIPLGRREDGRDRYFAWSPPMSDLANIRANPVEGLREVANMMSPMFKVPLELMTNQSMLLGAPIYRYPGEKGELMGVEVPKWAEHVGTSVVPTIRGLQSELKHAKQQSGEEEDISVVSRTRQFNPAQMFGMLKDYSPEFGERNAQYDYYRKLTNVVQALRDQGVEVPTMQEIDFMKRTGLPARFMRYGTPPLY